MASGPIKFVTFTPSADGTLDITVSGQAQGTSGGDWGASIFLRAYKTQSAVTTYGDQIRVSSTDRLPFEIKYTLSVTGGVSCDAGLYGDITGAVAVSCWDVKLLVTVKKR